LAEKDNLKIVNPFYKPVNRVIIPNCRYGRSHAHVHSDTQPPTMKRERERVEVVVGRAQAHL
jgi:hypothetical protein